MKNIFLAMDDPQTFLALYRERLNNIIQTLVTESVILWGCLLMLVWNESDPLTTFMSFALLTISLVSAGALWGHVRARRTFDKLIVKPLPFLERNTIRIAWIGQKIGIRLAGYSFGAASVFFAVGCILLLLNSWVGMFLIPWSFWIVWRDQLFVSSKHVVSHQLIGLKLPKV